MQLKQCFFCTATALRVAVIFQLVGKSYGSFFLKLASVLIKLLALLKFRLILAKDVSKDKRFFKMNKVYVHLLLRNLKIEVVQLFPANFDEFDQT